MEIDNQGNANIFAEEKQTEVVYCKKEEGSSAEAAEQAFESGLKVSLNGVRGSVPVSGTDYERYGGATCSIQLEYRGEILIVDAGTGILNTGLPKGTESVSILLTHPHVDHLMGLPAWAPAYQPKIHKAIAAVKYGKMDCTQQVAALMSGTLWPVRAEELPNTTFYTIEPTENENPCRISRFPESFPENREEFHFIETKRGRCLQNGAFRIYMMRGNHPGGSTCYRIETPNGKSVAVVLDCEMERSRMDAFVKFVQGCSLLICDGQYLEEEMHQKQGWGHSSAATAAALGRLSGVDLTVIAHHEPTRTDRDMLKIQEELEAAPGYEPGKVVIGEQGAQFSL